MGVQLGNKPSQLTVYLTTGDAFAARLLKADGTDWDDGTTVNLVLGSTPFLATVDGPALSWHIDAATWTTAIAGDLTACALTFGSGSAKVTIGAGLVVLNSNTGNGFGSVQSFSAPGVPSVTVQPIVGPAGPGVIGGGASGSVLAKASSSDFDTAWVALGSASTHAAGDFDTAGAAAAAQAAAATDATTKANSAQSAAATDATTKANSAQSAATAAAATDATTKVAAEATARASAITAAVTALVNGAPGALNTLNELATALGDDQAFATTVTNALAAKAPLVSPALTGSPTVNGETLDDRYRIANVPGAKADYNGRIGTPGTGTDNRALIQAALDAASDGGSGTGWFAYLARRSTKVVLEPGNYYISAPSSGPSLSIPDSVVFDTSAATLYFDFPASPTNGWCGIQVNQYAQLIVGKLFPKAKLTEPDSGLFYDCIRIVDTDDLSRVTGYQDSEIRDFRGGAAIRGIGADQTYVKGIRVTSCWYGYVASHHPISNVYGLTLSTSDPSFAAGVRTHTDLWIEDCSFVNIRAGNVVGVITGDAVTPTAKDTQWEGFEFYTRGCIYENTSGYALDLAMADLVSIDDCGFEEVGFTDGVNSLVNVTSLHVKNMRYYRQGGRSVPGPTGASAVPVPTTLFKLSAVKNVTVSGLAVLNTVGSTMTLADSAATNWLVTGVTVCPNRLHATFDFASGAMYAAGGHTNISGAEATGHLVVGGNHLWVDASGNLRRKRTAPTSDTDGDPVIPTEIQIPAPRLCAMSGTPPLLTVANGGSWPGWQMDPTTSQAVGTIITVPADWTTFDVILRGANNGAGSGGAVFRVTYSQHVAGDDLTATPTSSSNVTITAGTQGIRQDTTLLSGVAANTAKEQMIRIDRRAADAADTLANAYCVTAVILRKAS